LGIGKNKRGRKQFFIWISEFPYLIEI